MMLRMLRPFRREIARLGWGVRSDSEERDPSLMQGEGLGTKPSSRSGQPEMAFNQSVGEQEPCRNLQCRPLSARVENPVKCD